MYKHLFGDKSRKGMVFLVTIFQILIMLFFYSFCVESIAEFNYEFLDLVLAQENTTLTNKWKNAYELNKHF